MALMHTQTPPTSDDEDDRSDPWIDDSNLALWSSNKDRLKAFFFGYLFNAADGISRKFRNLHVDDILQIIIKFLMSMDKILLTKQSIKDNIKAPIGFTFGNLRTITTKEYYFKIRRCDGYNYYFEIGSVCTNCLYPKFVCFSIQKKTK